DVSRQECQKSINVSAKNSKIADVDVAIAINIERTGVLNVIRLDQTGKDVLEELEIRKTRATIAVDIGSSKGWSGDRVVNRRILVAIGGEDIVCHVATGDIHG